MKAKELKQKAKDALQGNWFSAIMAALIAASFGVSGNGITLTFEDMLPTPESNPGEDGVTALVSTITQQQGSDDMLGAVLGMYGAALVMVIISVLVSVLISSFVRVGYAQYNLDLIDTSSSSIKTLFSRMSQVGAAFRVYFLIFIRVFVGSLLILPGIVMSYSYAMSDFVLADNPGMGAKEALAESRRIMSGNRWKLFCLQLSFIGPLLLCVLTLGIGLLWFVPYQNAAIAAFYREAKRNA